MSPPPTPSLFPCARLRPASALGCVPEPAFEQPDDETVARPTSLSLSVAKADLGVEARDQRPPEPQRPRSFLRFGVGHCGCFGRRVPGGTGLRHTQSLPDSEAHCTALSPGRRRGDVQMIALCNHDAIIGRLDELRWCSAAGNAAVVGGLRFDGICRMKKSTDDTCWNHPDRCSRAHALLDVPGSMRGPRRAVSKQSSAESARARPRLPL
jgi:hypothetical protein